jgi:hypothetical protein
MVQKRDWGSGRDRRRNITLNRLFFKDLSEGLHKLEGFRKKDETVG